MFWPLVKPQTYFRKYATLYYEADADDDHIHNDNENEIENDKEIVFNLAF